MNNTTRGSVVQKINLVDSINLLNIPYYDDKDFSSLKNIRLSEGGNFRFDSEAGGKFFTKTFPPDTDLKDVIIPLGLETKSSEIELSFIERDLSDLYNIFLEDRLNNTIVKFDNKLKIDLENKVNGHNRFFLHFTDGLIPELPTDNDLRIFKNSSSNLSIIGNPNLRYKAKIFDYSGRLVKEAEFIHKSNIDELDNRMKILRIESKDGLTVKKFKLNY